MSSLSTPSHPQSSLSDADARPITLTMPGLLLRLEGLAVLIAAVALYYHLRGPAWLFIVLLLAPDLAMIGYAVNQSVGAVVYNSVHFYGLPLALAALALATGWQTGLLLALIWTAHIAMDRLAGYGFKYRTDFKETHLGRV
ncbi:DUF4260 domain-containing protein [Chloroflexota bacterium]